MNRKALDAATTAHNMAHMAYRIATERFLNREIDAAEFMQAAVKERLALKAWEQARAACYREGR